MSLRIGSLQLEVPVILAPMAGVTNAPFRQLCRQAGMQAYRDVQVGRGEQSTGHAVTSICDSTFVDGIDGSGTKFPDGAQKGLGDASASVIDEVDGSRAAGNRPDNSVDVVNATESGGVDNYRKSGTAPVGLYVTEMITSRALVQGAELTRRMVAPDSTDYVRSVQLYGVDPATMAAATRILVQEELADHIDLNFGCPVPKVMRKGGGAALPWKRDQFTQIIAAVVQAAQTASRGRALEVPVTIKMRTGIDAEHVTYLEAGQIAQQQGVAAVALHARTAAQHYSGHAHWEQIARLKESLRIPVLGNGDVFEGDDAVRMLAQTGCDGVVVGRGCQGRPWIFGDLVYALLGSERRIKPNMHEVKRMILRHSELMVAHFGGEEKALREMRKHIGWYLRGYRVGGEQRHRLGLVSTQAELADQLDRLDLDQPYPEVAAGPRGRGGGEKQPHLPAGWLDTPDLDAAAMKILSQAELDVSGG